MPTFTYLIEAVSRMTATNSHELPQGAQGTQGTDFVLNNGVLGDLRVLGGEILRTCFARWIPQAINGWELFVLTSNSFADPNLSADVCTGAACGTVTVRDALSLHTSGKSRSPRWLRQSVPIQPLRSRMKARQYCDKSAADDAAHPRWPIRARTWMLCGALAFGVGGCDFGFYAVLRFSVDPTVKTLRVGEAFAPRATVRGGCGKILSDAWSWTTTDSTVVRVE